MSVNQFCPIECVRSCSGSGVRRMGLGLDKKAVSIVSVGELGGSDWFQYCDCHLPWAILRAFKAYVSWTGVCIVNSVGTTRARVDNINLCACGVGVSVSLGLGGAGRVRGTAVVHVDHVSGESQCDGIYLNRAANHRSASGFALSVRFLGASPQLSHRPTANRNLRSINNPYANVDVILWEQRPTRAVPGNSHLFFYCIRDVRWCHTAYVLLDINSSCFL